MLRPTTPTILLLALLSAASAAAGTLDWPRWRGPDGTGIAPDSDVNPKALAGQPKIAWKASLGAGFSSVAIVGSLVYGLGNAGDTDTVFCLNADTGRIVLYGCIPTGAPRARTRGPGPHRRCTKAPCTL